MSSTSNHDSSPSTFESTSEPSLSFAEVFRVAGNGNGPTKIRQLKDRMWVRETLEDLTSAEFACSLTPNPNTGTSIANGGTSNTSGGGGMKLGMKRAVDFEALLQKLDRRIEDMCVVVSDNNREYNADVQQDDEMCLDVGVKLLGKGENQCLLLRSGEGMGSVVYTKEQRESLLLRVMSTRQNLIKAMSGTNTSLLINEDSNLDQIRSQLSNPSTSTSSTSELETLNSSAENDLSLDSSSTFPKLYVRDDGTVDWDGALQDREGLRAFGNSVWARINGQDPNNISEDNDSIQNEPEQNTRATAKIIETPQIKQMRTALDQLKSDLTTMENKHTALLNSAIPPTTPNPKVNMARIPAPLRAQIKASTLLLEQNQELVTYATLIYELERIFTYLEADLGNTFAKGYIPLQDRLAVAEFGLLESQIASLNPSFIENTSTISTTINGTTTTTSDTTDSDVLQVIMDQMTDFKRRLGIDYYVNVNPIWDTEALKRWSVDLLEKSKEGLEFYIKGCKLFWNDLVFCTWLLNRAIRGYTLKPREVRTLRRTFSDVITFIPFVIILIIPLTPVGHVFVFGAIQRFYPDFFPSMFTERRQNLLQLYESTEYSDITINENWKEKLLRFSEAVLLMTANSIRKLYMKLGGNDNTDKCENDKS